MKKDWIPTEAAAEELGITHRQLLELRRQGVFKSGKHYRKKNPTAYRPTYIWHVKRCSKTLES